MTNVGGTAATIHGVLGDTQNASSTDDAGFDNVGKTSLGDMELSDDEKDLYVINLFEKTLNKINIASGAVTTTAIPSPATGQYAADYRPFALKVHRGKVYVGVTVTNESSYPNPTPVYTNNAATTINSKGVNTTANPMRAVVYEYNGSAFTTELLACFLKKSRRAVRISRMRAMSPGDNSGVPGRRSTAWIVQMQILLPILRPGLRVWVLT